MIKYLEVEDHSSYTFKFKINDKTSIAEMLIDTHSELPKPHTPNPPRFSENAGRLSLDRGGFRFVDHSLDILRFSLDRCGDQIAASSFRRSEGPHLQDQRQDPQRRCPSIHDTPNPKTPSSIHLQTPKTTTAFFSRFFASYDLRGGVLVWGKKKKKAQLWGAPPEAWREFRRQLLGQNTKDWAAGPPRWSVGTHLQLHAGANYTLEPPTTRWPRSTTRPP